MGVLRVLVVDDHALVRESLSQYVNSLSAVEVVGQATTGPEAVEMAKRQRPCVVLMDYSISGFTGAEATRRIVARAPGVKVIGFSIHDADMLAKVMKDAGAVAYFSKVDGLDALTAYLEELRDAA